MALGAVGLSTHIWNNNLRSVLLLALYPVILMAVVWVIVWASLYFFGDVSVSYHSNARGASDLIGAVSQIVFSFAPFLIACVAIWFLIAWGWNQSMIRAMARSHPITRKDEPELYNLLENLCIAQGMPMPRLEIIETHARNAFASGIDQKSYTITLTRGLINALTRDEVEAVLAHELAHIINRDVRLLIVSIIFTGLFGLIAQIVWSNLRFGLLFGGRGYGRGRRGRGRGGDPRILLFMLAVAVIVSLGYVLSLLTRYAISRKREYLADAGAVEMTKNPEAMMRALQRIARHDRIPQTSPDVAMMCIENASPFLGLFTTHPPIDRRVATISAMTNTPVPTIATGIAASHQERFGGSPTQANPWMRSQK